MKNAKLCPSELGRLRNRRVFFDFRGISSEVYIKLYKVSRIYVLFSFYILVGRHILEPYVSEHRYFSLLVLDSLLCQQGEKLMPSLTSCLRLTLLSNAQQCEA